ncbi:MAG: DUF3179 domain-containing protein [Gammaproteobacteria bacterium]|nr:DUF3179 domain-containing protein [Gammaproteobacteria bacterium]
MLTQRLKKNRVFILLAVLVGLVTTQHNAFATSDNGFDLSNATIPTEQILHGGPPKDGIPAISNPKLITADKARYIDDQDRIVGININGIAKAYPIAILNWHEIVNDKINNQHFAITYCPLCGTAVAFDANVNGNVTEFGVSGLLYNSDVLLYDRNTESLWSQITSSAVAGKLVGEKLKRLPISHTSWLDWQQRHPDTMVLSDDTGYSRDYARNPYAGYEQSRSLFFSVNNRAPDNYHPKELVVGLEFGDVFKAYPFIELEKNGKASFSDQINGNQVTVNWNRKNRVVTIFDSGGKEIAGIQGFWFAWFAFHPDTEIFHAE